VRHWTARLWRDAIYNSWQPIAPILIKPKPAEWNYERLTVAWLGHATVLINFFGVNILSDPVLFPRIGVRWPGITLGPKRLTAPALLANELPKVDLIVLSHAHFDHFDLRTLHQFDSSTKVVTAPRTKDLLRWSRLRDVTELHWGEKKSIGTHAGNINIAAFPVKHWGARMQRDNYRGFNGYVLEKCGRRIVFSGDTARTESFAHLRSYGRVDLAIMSIGCYNPWIRTHCNPEQAVQMANNANAQFIMPVHHQTFRLSFEPSREPIERFKLALHKTPERIALSEIGETFVLPIS
jgi:L-ascorbate metabolism protein UlaG (beta-lactamase superfamily)